MTLDAKDPDVAATYTIDWEDELVQDSTRDRLFAQGEIARPHIPTGFYLECTTAGRTSHHYPQRMPRAAGETVADGSLIWTIRHPSTVTTATVSTATWTVPSGITKDSEANVGFLSSVTLSGGTDGVDYDCLCRMTPSLGPIREQTITVQVRHQ